MKSGERIGEVNKRIRNEEVLSFASNTPANKAINTVPNTATPGAICSGAYIVLFASAGIALLIIANKKSNTKGNARPKRRFNGSRRISLAVLVEKMYALIAHLRPE